MQDLAYIVARNVRVARDADKFAAQAYANAREWERRAALAETREQSHALHARATHDYKQAGVTTVDWRAGPTKGE